MTGEQLTVLGLLAAAFVAGWVAGSRREGKRESSRSDAEAGDRKWLPARGHGDGRTRHAQVALQECRQALNRVTSRYHGTVTAWLQDEAPATISAQLANEVLGLADAMESASVQLHGSSSARELRSSAQELRQLATELSSNPQLELPWVLDHLEQDLVAATVAVSSARRLARKTRSDDGRPSSVLDPESPAASQRS
jgi:hypothetical protein